MTYIIVLLIHSTFIKNSSLTGKFSLRINEYFGSGLLFWGHPVLQLTTSTDSRHVVRCYFA